MNNVLSFKLAEIEKSSPIRNNKDLLGAVLSVIKDERSKRASARDFDLLDEAIDASFALEGRDCESIASDAALVMERALGAVSEEKGQSYTSVRTKWLIPAVVIIILLLAAVVGATVFDLPFFDSKNRAKVREELPNLTAGTVYELDGWEIYVGDEMEEVYSLNELDDVISREGLLLPYGYEEGVMDISAADYGESCRITIRTDIGLVDVKTDTGWGNAAPNFVRTGRFDVVYSNYNDVYQGEFVFNNCMYCITSETKEGLEKLIGSMEERAK